jgi:hypothetical protein
MANRTDAHKFITFNSLPFAIPKSGTMDIQLGVDVVDVPVHRVVAKLQSMEEFARDFLVG